MLEGALDSLELYEVSPGSPDARDRPVAEVWLIVEGTVSGAVEGVWRGNVVVSERALMVGKFGDQDLLNSKVLRCCETQGYSRRSGVVCFGQVVEDGDEWIGM